MLQAEVIDVPVLDVEKASDDNASSAPDELQNIVDFDGDSDPDDPVNWKPYYKWSLVILISALSLVVNLAILMIAPAYSDVLREFNSTSKIQSTLLVSIWELGEVVGPLVIAPLTEIYGRLPVYHVANVLFLIFSVVGALSSSMSMLIAVRFLLGMCVASTVINPCIVGDMFREEQRGRAMGIMGMIPFIAPVLGPTIGGIVVDARDWRWTFWTIVLIGGPLQLLFMILYRETYKVTILERRVRRLQKETGNTALRSRYADKHGSSVGQIMMRSVLRPLKLLCMSPLVGAVGLCSAFGMGLVYVMITSLSLVYSEFYHFEQKIVGLTYLGMGLGMILGVTICGTFIDWYLTQDSRLVHGRSEKRLPPMLLGAILVPFALIAFGWTVEERAHWVVPIIVTLFIGFGYVAIAVSAWSYLVDVFGIYSASATAGNVVLRNLLSATLPLAGPPLVDKIGFGWGYLVLSLVAFTISTPLAVWLLRRGERIRAGMDLKKLI